MDDYKYQLRRRKRGEHCLINAGAWGKICGCGHRTPPSKKEKNRIVRRTLDRQFMDEVVEQLNGQGHARVNNPVERM